MPPFRSSLLSLIGFRGFESRAELMTLAELRRIEMISVDDQIKGVQYLDSNFRDVFQVLLIFAEILLAFARDNLSKSGTLFLDFEGTRPLFGGTTPSLRSRRRRWSPWCPWAANKRLEISKFKFKFPRARSSCSKIFSRFFCKAKQREMQMDMYNSMMTASLPCTVG